jgi:metallophosphoesterase superfamily enzyme
MRLAILSDLHLGDDGCRYLTDGLNNPEGLYHKQINAIRNFSGSREPLDYLVFNGDVLDFSINSIYDSFNISRPFFEMLSLDNVASRIIYIPGNHDHFIWDALEWDTNIISNLIYIDDNSIKSINL